MKKSAMFLRLVFVAMAVVSFCSVVQAQIGSKSVHDKNYITVPSSTLQENSQLTENHNNPDQPELEQVSSTTKSVSKATESDINIPINSGTRNCKTKTSMKPYSINRADFNKLPKDRQQFILSNSNKYILVD